MDDRYSCRPFFLLASSFLIQDNYFDWILDMNLPFTTFPQAGLRSHIKNMHDITMHKCDQCDYTNKNPAQVAHHKKYKHEGIVYPCDQCDYLAAKNAILIEHKRVCILYK